LRNEKSPLSVTAGLEAFNGLKKPASQAQDELLLSKLPSSGGKAFVTGGPNHGQNVLTKISYTSSASFCLLPLRSPRPPR
jgi:hypothetical protein